MVESAGKRRGVFIITPVEEGGRWENIPWIYRWQRVAASTAQLHVGSCRASRVSEDALLMLAEKVTEKVSTLRKVRGLDASAPRVVAARDGCNGPSPAGFVIVPASRYMGASRGGTASRAGRCRSADVDNAAKQSVSICRALLWREKTALLRGH
jgi:hypothetical protein